MRIKSSSNYDALCGQFLLFSLSQEDMTSWMVRTNIGGKKHFHLWEWERIQFSWVPPGRSLILCTHLICLSSRFFLVSPWDHEANCYSLCNNEMVFFLQYLSCAGFCCEFRIRLRIVVVVVRMDTDRQKTDNCCPIVFELEREECDWKEKKKILIGKCQRAISGKNSNWCEIQHEL